MKPIRLIPRANCRGFTYLWVLLLVALMGVGLVLAVEIDSTAAQREQEKEMLSIGRQFRRAIGQYHETQIVGGKREYPASLDDLLKDNRFPGMRRHLRKIFVDPMTGKAEWGLVRVGGRIVGVHSLSERTPIKQEGFEPEDMSLRGKQKISEWVFTYPPELLVQAGEGVAVPAEPSTGEVGSAKGK
ncbi:MAG: type secretion system protein [Proteobacteria bacterium]|nr:type secretion system protein [Pseudomonadota bacterium]